MALPRVQINVQDGALGRTTATEDGVAGLVLTGSAATGLALNTPARIFSVADAVALGIGSGTHAYAHKEISDFYAQAGSGAELWILLVANTTTAAATYAAGGPMHVLLTGAGGRVTIASAGLGRAAGYTPTVTGLLDYDLPAVGAAAQTLGNLWASAYTPVRFVLDGSYLITTITTVASMKGTGDRVMVFTGTNTASRSASVGLVLGRLAAKPVHQSLARVKDGFLAANGWLTSGLTVDSYSEATLGLLHDAGYTVLRKYTGLLGYYASDDVTLAAATSDFGSMARGRVIDKAIRLAYQTYVNELHDTIEITAEGKLSPTKVSYLEDVILRALRQRMLAEGNVSGVEVSIDPNQNVLSTDRVTVVLKVRPLGYLKDIVVQLGFENPSTT